MKTSCVIISRIRLLSLIVAFAQFAAIGQWKAAGSLPQISFDKPVMPVLVTSSESNTAKIVLHYQIPGPEFSSVGYQTVNGTSTLRCVAGNADELSLPGEPVVPRIPVRFVLPDGKTVDHMRVIVTDKVEMELSAPLAYGENEIPISSQEISYTAPNTTRYASDAPYPATNAAFIDVQYRNGIAIGIADVYPLTYYPLSNKVIFAKALTVEITTKNSEANNFGIRVDKEMFTQMGGCEENMQALDTYKDGEIKGSYEHVLCRENQQVDYVIITNKEIIDAKTTPNINDLIELRKSQGLTGKVQDIASVYSSYSGSNSEKLRSFIKDSYNNWKVKFVCLGGDINVVPLKRVTCTQGGKTDSIPSDLPYFCLEEATWANDYTPEVALGRISAKTPETFANCVFKTIAYAKTPESDSYLKTCLGLGEKLDASTFANVCIKAIQDLFKGCTFEELQDQGTTAWKPADVVTKINSDKFSVVNHLGHSNTTIVMKLNSSSNWKPDNFTNKKFSFAYSQGCIPGAFDRDCIGEAMTVLNRTGMFAVNFNARYGWYQPGNPTTGSSNKQHKFFWDAYWSQGKEYIGQCNGYARQQKVTKWDAVEANLLGDPATKFRLKGSNTAIEQNISSTLTPIGQVFTISPNPAHRHQMISIHYPALNGSFAKITIYSINGKNIKSFALASDRSVFQLNLQSSNAISPGIYVAILTVTNAANVSREYKNILNIQQ